jgi:hypothetical protein
MFDSNICAQNPVCVDIYNEGLALMNKKNKESYREAIRRFEAAVICDAKLRDNCSKRIDECKKAIDSPDPDPPLIRVSKEKIGFPEQGGVENISVSGDNNWTVSDNADWCVAERGNNLVVITCEPNKTTLSRTAVIEIRGRNNQIKIPVGQEAAKEQLSAMPSSLTFPAEGKEDVITVYSNTPWDVTTALSWCRVEKDDNTIKVKIGANDSPKERKGDITVKSKTLTRTISVSQGAGKESPDVSETKSENASSGRDTSSSRGAYTERDPASEEDNTPPQPQRNTASGRDSNIPPQRNIVSEDDNTPFERNTPAGNDDLSGRKISFGIMANALIPSFSVKASGFVGSAIDYGHGKNIENPSYSFSKTGFSGGLVADIRVSKNIYVQTGLYYTNLDIRNVMSGNYDCSVEYYTPATYLEGTGYDNFTEEYTLNYLEIPVLFSYRIPLAKKAALQINAGPYVGYGLSAKGKIKGTREFPSLTEYEYAGNRSTGNVYERKSTVTGEIDMFGKSGHIYQIYLTGEEPDKNDDDFKNAPFKNIDAGVSMGVALEYAGINLGVYYDMGLMNMANATYWKSERMRLFDEKIGKGGTPVNSYVHKLNKIQIRIGYIYRW